MENEYEIYYIKRHRIHKLKQEKYELFNIQADILAQG